MSNKTIFPLTKEQQNIVNSKGNTLVVSNPGTGKTVTLSSKVMNLLDNGVKPEDILCITFTEKARKEMFDRIYFLASKKIPISEIMKISIHTFHSFAFNYLQNKGLISGDVLSENFLRYYIFKSFKKHKSVTYGDSFLIDKIIPKTTWAIRYLKSFGILPDSIEISKTIKHLAKLRKTVKTTYDTKELTSFLNYMIIAYKEYEQAKNQSIDYSDMLIIFNQKFQGQKFEHVLVDEMQDMSGLEAGLVKLVSKSLFLVGDSKQAIFGFQGGSIKNFQSFKNSCTTMILSKNMRSAQEILDYSKKNFLARTKSPKDYEPELKTFNSNKRGKMPTVFFTEAVASKILEIIVKNPNKTIGILARNKNQILTISKHLDKNSVNYSSTSFQSTVSQAYTEIISFLKGKLSKEITDKIVASLTIFSSYSMQEAFKFSEAYENKDKQGYQKLNNFGINLGKQQIDEIFNNVIFPISTSKGFDWYSTSVDVKTLIDDYLSFGTPTMQGLFDYLSISDESFIERDVDAQIILSTVHKAKGLEFDVVIYVPDNRTNDFSLTDLIVESILSSKNINVQEEIEEESLRVDFVAYTRAKDELFIITSKEKDPQIYHIEKYSEYDSDTNKDENITIQMNSKMVEAFSLFVAKRFDDSKKLLNSKDDWLRDMIKLFFKNLKNLSYSKIETHPHEFLKKFIINIPWSNSGLTFGQVVHGEMKKILTELLKTGKFKQTNLTGEHKKAVNNAFLGLGELKKRYKDFKLVSVEEKTTIPLKLLDKSLPDDMIFTGKTDAIFSHSKGLVIVDFKTDKRESYKADHFQQLSAYKKMLSISANISEDKITTHLIYVSLQGGISTGRFDFKVYDESSRDVFKTFLKHLQNIISWKENPDLFIQAFLNKKTENNEPLIDAIKEKLS